MTMAGYGLIVDAGRCSGCMTCVVACKQENLTGPGVFWNRVFQLEIGARNRISYFRYGCMHCDKPACAEACPEQAIYRRPDGIVLIDHQKCKGHGACVRACPYGVMDIDSGRQYFDGPLPFETARDGYATPPPGKPSICTLCVHRVELGKEPACVEACPARALIFGDLEDPDSPIGKMVRRSGPLLPHKGLKPRVTYITEGNMLKLMEDKALERLRA